MKKTIKQQKFLILLYSGKRFYATRSVQYKKTKASQSVSKNNNIDSILEKESHHITKILNSINMKKSNEQNIENIKNIQQPMNKPRKNEFNIQMISENLYHQIFGKNPTKMDLLPKSINDAISQLKKHELWNNEINLLPEVYLNLPSLKGKNIEEHFWNIGTEQSEPYKNLIERFILNGIPKPPENWLCQKGWTKYEEGKSPQKVKCPEENALVFDTEVCVKLGELPTLATAVSETSWYGWVCSDLSEGADPPPTKFYYPELLIPFENKKESNPKIIVGHSVSYDRLRIKEQYFMTDNGLRFLDTMALHICIGGLSSSQKTTLKKNVINNSTNSFLQSFCLSSLKDTYKLYCGKDLEKENQKVFLEKTLPYIKDNFQVLMKYCAHDVIATFEVLQVIFPIFISRCPHPVTLAGMLEMGLGYLPVNSNWKKFLTESDQTYKDLNNEMNTMLSRKSDIACQLFHNEKYKEDLWMWDENWSIQELKLKKTRSKKRDKINDLNVLSNLDEEEQKLFEKFKHLFVSDDDFPKKKPFLPGYPLWYRKLLEKSNWTVRLSTSLVITPKILQLTWENFPLHYTQKFGWGILVADIYAKNVNTSLPFEKLKELTIKNCKIDNDTLKCEQNLNQNSPLPYYTGTGIWCDHKVDNCCYFYKLPHKDGSDKNVGNPLSKDFIQIFSSNLLSSPDSTAERIMNIGMKFTYWRNSRNRILSQMVVWLNKNSSTVAENYQTGVILPKTVVCGTLTRRALEPTWLTASKTVENRIGSELRSMVQAPPGYHIIGADVDSQELWIASLIGDSHSLKIHGSTPLGWMTISGTKANGTDMHSVTAKKSGISRSHAKIINYARIYGAGLSFATKLLLQYNPSMTVKEAEEKAKIMFTLTKGQKIFEVKPKMKKEFNCKFGKMEVNDWNVAHKVATKFNRKFWEVFERPYWKDGTESATFNQLEKIAVSKNPVTPFLSSRITYALEPQRNGDRYNLNTRINWVVQSGAVDFLHLMLVCMRWLTNGRARYCFSFHDEIRYLIPSDERYNGALAVQITHLLVRSFCASRLKMYDLPLSVAFFSSVEIDKVLRKEANDDCVTPSNPYGLEKGYGIPRGEALNIYETIEKSKGSLEPFFKNQVLTCFFICYQMSQATKRKHVHREILQGYLELPSENQQIVQVIGSRGNNLHEVKAQDSTSFLISMPTKFRKNVWIKKGDYILVEPINEGGKVKAEMVKVLTADYIKFIKKENRWPVEFSEIEEKSLNCDTFVNKNHNIIPKSDSSGESE